MARSFYCTHCLHAFQRELDRCPNLVCRRPRPSRGWGELLATGALLDRYYEVERVLAVGGAGITYLAHRVDEAGTRHPPPVAIKVLFQTRDSGSFLKRLALEAQVLRDLDHEHIVQCMGFVHRIGESPYLVTRFEAGGDLLSHAQRNGPLPAEVALAVLRQVLRALDVAHRAGVVHRDLKPENVLVEAEVARHEVPRVRVTDFGVAKLMTAPSHLTRVGAFVGTPEYAAPEQFVGEPATPGTDVFAAGGLLHFMLTNRTPVEFSNRSELTTCYQELVKGCPPDVSQIDMPGHVRTLIEALFAGMMDVERPQRWSAKDALTHLAALELPTPQASHGSTIDPVPHVARTAPRGATLLPEDDALCPDLGDRGFVVIDDEPPRSLTLEDLFTFQGDSSAPDIVPAESASEQQAPPRDPFAGGPMARSGIARHSVREPQAQATPAVPQPLRGLPLHTDGTLWAPEAPVALPDPLPDTPVGLMALLGAVRPKDRQPVVEALAIMESRPVNHAVRAAVTAREIDVRVGANLAIAGLQRPGLSTTARRMLTDTEAIVRACAAHALGLVGKRGALGALSRALDDDEAIVRACTALAIARAGRAAGQAKTARDWLRRIDGDPSPLVAAARDTARDWLS